MTDRPEGLVVARIVIERVLTETDDLVWTSSEGNDGEGLPLIESLGMLRLAEDTVIRDAMGESPDE